MMNQRGERIGRNSPQPDETIPPEDTVSTTDHTFHSRSSGAAVIKRYTHSDLGSTGRITDSVQRTAPDRRFGRGGHRGWYRGAKKGLFQCGSAEKSFLLIVFCFVVMFVLSSVVPQRMMRFGTTKSRSDSVGLGEVVKFFPRDLLRRFAKEGGINVLRTKMRFGVRPPRLGLVLGTLNKDPSSLMLLTIFKCLREIGYSLKVFAVVDGEAHSLWEQFGCQIKILSFENSSHVDWTIFEGVIMSSLETKNVVSSLQKEPFNSVPLIWIIHEDILAKRVPIYEKRGWTHLISDWKSAFSRADVVVFPDFTLPMLHTAFDSGNFFVIPGYPVDVWDAEIYSRSYSRDQLRKDKGFHRDDILIIVTGNSLYFDGQSWNAASVMHDLGPQLTKFAKTKGLESILKFLFLYGNSTNNSTSSFEAVELILDFPPRSQHYGFDNDLNGILLIADIVLYTSFHEELNFPPILMRAMSFGVPIIAPDMSIIKENIVDKVNGFIYHSHDIKMLNTVFSLLISDMKLSDLAHNISLSAKIMSKNMFAFHCMTDYIKLLENVIIFPSDTILPLPKSHIQQQTWEWGLFEDIQVMVDTNQFQNINLDDYSMSDTNIVMSIENKFVGSIKTVEAFRNNTESFNEDFPTELDLEKIGEIETSEEVDRLEVDELEDRIEKNLGSWEYIYNNARRAEKKTFERNEQDEGELERFGRTLCIYEIYNGAGAWPFLHNGSIYRGMSLSKGVQRPKSDDVDAVERLSLLANKFYSDILCEMGGMFSIAKKVDNIHKNPWIGFQSWRAIGKKVSLNNVAERQLDKTILEENNGDVIYFWAKMDLGSNDDFNFWPTCDILNDGNCRSAFEDTFRKMYSLPNYIPALPPMPTDGDYWSTLHSWVMPTSSFLKFIMFSRMFVDSLHKVNNSHATNSCLLGSSKSERKHCYCQLLEHIVNVWAYHSAIKMVYIDPLSGELHEQHPVELRKGKMWVRYFNFSLLKSMDEDFAEEADDDLPTTDPKWLWPLTGEVHWQGILDQEREDRYRKKMNKQKRSQEKQLMREKHGYKQKALGT